MKITKELILKIELSGEDLEHFKTALERVLQFDKTANLDVGFLNKEQKQILETIINSLKV